MSSQCANCGADDATMIVHDRHSKKHWHVHEDARVCVARLREENERLRSLANRARDHFLGYVVLNFEQEQALANEIGEEVRGE